jgi:hypothetical protein
MMRLFSLVGATIWMAGCAMEPAPHPGGVKKNPDGVVLGPAKPKSQPQVGWTKEQVVAAFGKTNSRTTHGDGTESWSYPNTVSDLFNLGSKPKSRIINFGPDGKVKSWGFSK